MKLAMALAALVLLITVASVSVLEAGPVGKTGQDQPEAIFTCEELDQKIANVELYKKTGDERLLLDLDENSEAPSGIKTGGPLRPADLKWADQHLAMLKLVRLDQKCPRTLSK